MPVIPINIAFQERGGEAHHERSRDEAPERARAEEEALGVRDALEVERGEDAPAHELQVEVDSLIGESACSCRVSIFVCVLSIDREGKGSRVESRRGSREEEDRDERKSGKMHLRGSIIGAKSAMRGASLPCGLFSHPTAPGFSPFPCTPSATPLTTPSRLRHLPSCGASASRQQRILGPGEDEKRDGWRWERYARRLRSGQPGFVGAPEGSRKPTRRCVSTQT